MHFKGLGFLSSVCRDQRCILLISRPLILISFLTAVAKQELVVSNELPPGWAEHWHLQYKRYYYYNEQTGQSVWERPKAPPPTKTPPPLPLPNRGRRMSSRPLPSVPMAVNTENMNYEPIDAPTNIVRRESSKKRGRGRPQQPLPAIPGQGEVKQNGYHSSTLPSRRSSSSSDRDLPPLPPKEDTPVFKRNLPPLPPKEDAPVIRRDHPLKEQTNPPGVPTRGGSSAPGNVNRPPIPIPESPSRGESSQDKVQRSLPPLPPKEDTPERRSSVKPRPKTPHKPTPSLQNGVPPLPPKEDSKPLPPLPPKADESTGPPPPQPPLKTSQAKSKRKKVVEYEDTVLLHQPDGKPKSTTQPFVPPLPDKEPPPPPVAGGPPPPPPPPAVGVPVPPPPPSAPPPPSPLIGKSRGPSLSVSTPSPQGSPNTGRPFTATDLASQRTLLKKREAESLDSRRNTTPSGMAGVFANAIDMRRKAIVDSDSEPSDFEDVEDDDDWD